MPVFRTSPGRDPLETTAVLMLCDCGCKEHMIEFSYWPRDEWPELFFEFHLVTHRNILKRLWVAIRHVFGYRCRYGEWDELVMNPKDAKSLARFLVEYAEIALKQYDKTQAEARAEMAAATLGTRATGEGDK
jgi:hypothetical protein